MGTRVRSYSTQVAQGEGWVRSLTYRADNAAGTAISLVGATVEVYVADQEGNVVLSYEATEGGVVIDAIDFTDAADGELTVAIPGEDTAGLDAHEHRIEMWISLSGAEPIQVMPPSAFKVRPTVRS